MDTDRKHRLLLQSLTSPPADVYISHSEDSDEFRAAQDLKKSIDSFATSSSCISHEMMRDRDAADAWLIEKNIKEVMSASKTFVVLISEAMLDCIARAHEEWNLALVEWDKALQLYNKELWTL